MLSYQKIGNLDDPVPRDGGGHPLAHYLFALPGSPSACRDGWEMILRDQLITATARCNFVELFPRLREHEGHGD